MTSMESWTHEIQKAIQQSNELCKIAAEDQSEEKVQAYINSIKEVNSIVAGLLKYLDERQ